MNDEGASSKWDRGQKCGRGIRGTSRLDSSTLAGAVDAQSGRLRGL